MVSLPDNLSRYKLPSIDIISKIKKYLTIPIVDKSDGVVLLDKQCFTKYEKDKIIKDLKKAFLYRYKDINISKISIKPINSFPKNFSNFSYCKLKINSLRKKRGNFAVLYKDSKDQILRVYFQYDINAKIYLFKAKHNIHNGKILSQNDYKKIEVDFDKIPANFAKDLKNGIFLSKNYIKKDSIITNYMIKKVTLVRKKDTLRSVISLGGVKIEFFAKALEDGDKGDIIKVLGDNGKIYRAKIIEKNLAEIQ